LNKTPNCQKCKNASSAVGKIEHKSLRVAPLDSPEVVEWRKLTLGSNPPWTPTLLRVHGSSVKVWTGRAMAVRLAVLLKPRKTMRLLQALAKTSQSDAVEPREETARTMGRANFLKLAAGVAVVGSLIGSGRTIAQAAEVDPVNRWLQVNINSLPQEYEEVVKFPIVYRKAIFRNSTLGTQSRLWVTHLNKYLAEHKVSEKQETLIREVIRFASNDRVFDPQAREVRHGATLNSLRDQTFAEFDIEQVKVIFATLGPVDDARNTAKSNEALSFDCTCAGNRLNDCASSCRCLGPCTQNMSGCGWLWSEPCIGVCAQC
jgi:hypothetical protein